MNIHKRKLVILGVRGVPAQHGGFETFAEYLCRYLIDRNWEVTVYCQEEGAAPVYETDWEGVRRIHIPVSYSGPLGTIIFDLKSIIHSLRFEGVFLTLGYNTAVFNLLHRLKGKTNLINMDGIEWRRDKWGFIAKTWFWLNERFGCWFGNHLIADHPKIMEHLTTRVSTDKVSMIPYGADEVVAADADLLKPYGLEPGGFSVVIARPEPENSFLEMVLAFSRKRRDHTLVVLGSFDLGNNDYHRQVVEAASSEIFFPGAIYDAPIVKALRFFCRFYLHGHRVGGTNPSLVEALGAGCAVIAHDNHFNRWVAGPEAMYFKDEEACASLLDSLLNDDISVERMKASSRKDFRDSFQWECILKEYEQLLTEWYPKALEVSKT